jgi:hypothetical protein
MNEGGYGEFLVDVRPNLPFKTRSAAPAPLRGLAHRPGASLRQWDQVLAQAIDVLFDREATTLDGR